MRTVVFALLALVGLAACGGDDPPEQPDAAVLLDAGPTKGKRDCPHGYSGEHCEQKVVTCGDNPCDRGVCVDYGNSSITIGSSRCMQLELLREILDGLARCAIVLRSGCDVSLANAALRSFDF